MVEHPPSHDQWCAALSDTKGLHHLAQAANISERRLRDIARGRAIPNYATAQKLAWAIDPKLTAHDIFRCDLAGQELYRNPHGRMLLRISFVTRTSIRSLMRLAGISRSQFERLMEPHSRLSKQSIRTLHQTFIAPNPEAISCLK